MKEEIKQIKNDIKDIKDNHLHGIHKTLTEHSIDLKWLKTFFWKIASPVLTAIGGGIVYLIYAVTKL